MKRHAGLLLSLTLASAGVAFGQAVQGPENSVATGFAILVGYPSADQPASSGVLLVPGSVIPLSSGESGPEKAPQQQVVDKSLSFTKAVEKLWSTFRLDPSRQAQKGAMAFARIGEPVSLPELEVASVKITATLTGFDETAAKYRIVFRQGEKTLADSTVTVNRGGRAVVGGMDGTAAPYIFVFIEPAAAGAKTSRIFRVNKDAGITEPVLISKVLPAYPEEAKKNRIEGVVVVEVVIDAEGKVEDVRMLEAPDTSLAQAAVDAVRQWRYVPARDSGGKAVKVLASVTINFKLK